MQVIMTLRECWQALIDGKVLLYTPPNGSLLYIKFAMKTGQLLSAGAWYADSAKTMLVRPNEIDDWCHEVGWDLDPTKCVVYQEPIWYENIPSSGVLCKCTDPDDMKNEVMLIRTAASSDGKVWGIGYRIEVSKCTVDVNTLNPITAAHSILYHWHNVLGDIQDWRDR